MRGRDALHLVHPRVAQVTRESPRVRRLPAASLIGAAVGMLLAARRGQAQDSRRRISETRTSSPSPNPTPAAAGPGQTNRARPKHPSGAAPLPVRHRFVPATRQ